MPTDPGRGLTLAVLGLCTVLLAPILTFRLGLDQGVFAYIGAEWLDGGLPYVDTWDHAFPGAMVLHALVIALFGRSSVAFRAVDLGLQLAVAYLIFRIAHRVAGRAGAVVAAVVQVSIYQSYGPWNTGQREGFGMLFVLLGVWFALTPERRPRWVTAASVGLGLGLAALFKPTLLALAALYLPLATGARWRRPPVLVAGAAAALLPVAAVIAFYAAHGALTELYRATIVYQLEVYRPSIQSASPWLSELAKLGARTVGLALVYPLFLLSGPARRERCMIYLGYLAAAYSVYVQGTYAGYHHLPGLAFGSILVGSMFARIADAAVAAPAVPLGRWRARAKPLLAAGVVLAAIAVYQDSSRVRALLSGRFLGPPGPGDLRIGTVFDVSESYRLGEWLKARTDPGDRVQVWGHESIVYYFAERSAASRFQTSNPLVTRPDDREVTPMQRAWQRELVADLERHAPPYVAVTRDDHWWWAPGERSSFELVDEVPGLRQLLEERYVEAEEVGRFLIYRLHSSTTDPQRIRSISTQELTMNPQRIRSQSTADPQEFQPCRYRANVTIARTKSLSPIFLPSARLRG